MIGFFLKRWLLSHLLCLIGFGAATLSVLAVLFGARQAGRNAERIGQLKKTLEVKNEQLQATMEAPRTRADLLKWLRRGKL